MILWVEYYEDNLGIKIHNLAYALMYVNKRGSSCMQICITVTNSYIIHRTSLAILGGYGYLYTLKKPNHVEKSHSVEKNENYKATI